MSKSTKPSMVIVTLILLFVLLGLIFLSYNSKSKSANAERFYAESPQNTQSMESSVASNFNSIPDNAANGLGNYAASDPQGNESYNTVQGGGAGNASGIDASPTPSCFPRDRLSANDLLPHDAANERWSQLNPSGQGDVQDQNFLTAGYHVGINTQGASLRNANLQLRSEPPCPQLPVSPWNVSTITPDLMRKPLET